MISNKYIFAVISCESFLLVIEELDRIYRRKIIFTSSILPYLSLVFDLYFALKVSFCVESLTTHCHLEGAFSFVSHGGRRKSIRMLICGPFNSDLIPLSRAAYTKLFYIERRSFYSPHDFIIIAHYYILFSSLAFLLHCSLKSIDIWLLPASNVFLSFI